MKKFLIVNPFGIGDVLFTTPVISNIKDAHPDAIIGYWCNERVRGILEGNPDIDKLFALSRGDIKKIYAKSKWEGISKSLSLFLRLRKEKFDVALDYSLDHRYGLLCKLAGIKRRIGFNYKNRGRFLTDKLDLVSYSDKHAVEYYLGLLKLITIKPHIFKLSLHVRENYKKIISKKLVNYGIADNDLLIGILPGAGGSWGLDASFKHWPALNFANLADKLVQNYNAKIIILGDHTERPIANAMISGMKEKPLDLVGKTSLQELVAIIDKLHILVTNDGGPLHIGVALNKKTLSLFGPVDPMVYGPYPPDKERHIVLKSSLECSPCYNNFRLAPCLNNKECLRGIGVERVFEGVSRLLSRKENI